MLYFILQFFLLVYLFIFYIHCKWRRSFIYYWTFIFLLFVMQGSFFCFFKMLMLCIYLCKKIRGDFNFFKLIWLTKDWPIAHWPGTKSETKRHRWVRFRGVLGLKQRSSKWDGGREREKSVLHRRTLALSALLSPKVYAKRSVQPSSEPIPELSPAGDPKRVSVEMALGFAVGVFGVLILFHAAYSTIQC